MSPSGLTVVPAHHGGTAPRDGSINESKVGIRANLLASIPPALGWSPGRHGQHTIQSMPRASGFRPGQVVVTCEHASNRLPAGFHLDRAVLEDHVAHDPGARILARRIARHFDAPLHEGQYSRLVVDLNRTVGNRMLMRRVSDGHRIPFNYRVSAATQQARIDQFYRPYREAVDRLVVDTIAEEACCVHLCIHTFTPVLAGKWRGNDIGILYDPSRQLEAAAARELRDVLVASTGLVIWLNRPYSGTADGILPAIRRLHESTRFVGIELEVNQRFASNRGHLLRIADAFSMAVEGLKAFG